MDRARGDIGKAGGGKVMRGGAIRVSPDWVDKEFMEGSLEDEAVPAWKASRLSHLAHLQAHHSNVQVHEKTNDGIRLLLLAALVTLLTLLLFSLMVSTLFGQRTNV